MYAQQPGRCILEFFYLCKNAVTADRLQVSIPAADAYIGVSKHLLGTMTLLQYHARPKDKPVNADDIAGAYINCWINDNNQEAAEQKALKMMDENGWTEFTLDEVYNVTRSDYSEDDQQLEYFDQALIDDEVLVVYTYPLVDKDEE